MWPLSMPMWPLWMAYMACVLPAAARVELHVHLDGSLEAPELLRIAHVRGISELPTGEELTLATGLR